MKEQEVLHIQIAPSSYKPNQWCVSSGDILGKQEFTNLTKKEVIEFVQNQIDRLEEELQSAEVKKD